MSKLQAELLRERKDSSDLDMYKRRYQDSSKEILKLERALELKVYGSVACTGASGLPRAHGVGKCGAAADVSSAREQGGW